LLLSASDAGPEQLQLLENTLFILHVGCCSVTAASQADRHFGLLESILAETYHG
jgi:hypothetical protein